MDQVQLSPDDSTEAIKRALHAGLVPYMRGNPGVGKSQIMHAIAKLYNLKLIDIRLATADPTDLSGFPEKKETPAGQINRMGYAPPEDIPLEGDPLPKGYAGWFLFFDELPQAFPSIQNSVYKILLDKKVGQHSVHPNCVMACAGNLDTDKANTHRMSTALQSRLIHLYLRVTNTDWQKHAVEAGYDYRVRAFLRWKPKLLHNFKAHQDSKSPEDTYACPRTWEFASKQLLKRPNELDPVDLALLVGTVGKGPAVEFQGYAALYDKVADYADILAHPTKIEIPTEPSILHAYASLVAHEQHLDTLPDIIPFIDRMPVEFQVWALRDAIKMRPSLLHNPQLEVWKDKYADRLY
jgi:hypothetical protein